MQAAADKDAPVAQPAAAPADDNSKSRWGWLSPAKLWSAQPVASDVGDRDGASTVGPVAAAEKGLEVREEVAKLRVEQLAVTSSKLHTLSAALESKTAEHTKAAAAATQELSDAQARLEQAQADLATRTAEHTKAAAAKDAEVRDVTTRLAAAERELADVKARLKEAEAHLETKTAEHAKQTEAKDTEVQNLKQRLAVVQAQRALEKTAESLKNASEVTCAEADVELGLSELLANEREVYSLTAHTHTHT